MESNKLNLVALFLGIIHFLLFEEFVHLSSMLFYFISIIAFIVYNTLYLKEFKGGNYFCFELLFCLSFFAACLLYPFMIDLISTKVSYLSPVFEGCSVSSRFKFFNLSLLSYYVYMFALTKGEKHNNTEIGEVHIPKSVVTLSNALNLICIVIFLYKGGMQVLNRYSGGLDNFSQYGNVLFYITVFFTISTMFNFLAVPESRTSSLMAFYHGLSPLYKYSAIFLIGLMLISGYRSQAIQLLFPIVMMYVIHVNPIPLKRLLIFMFAGVFLMIIIGFTRSGENISLSGFDATDYFRDYLMEGAAGVWLMEYTDMKGPTWGSNAILQIVSFIPFAQSLLVSLLGKSFFAESSSRLFTYAFRDDGSGLGSNMIGDLYYTFGIWGVIICMYLLGRVLKKVSNPSSIYHLLILLLLVGNSVFSTRVEFFYIIRTIGFSVIFLYLIQSLTSKKQYAHFNN